MEAEATERRKSTIFINGRFLEQPLSGVQRYGRELLEALDRMLSKGGGREESWCLLTTGNERDCPRLERIEKRPVPSKFRGHAWEQAVLGRAARGGALVGFGGSGPLLHSRQLVVIHDASVFRHSEFYSTRYALWHRIMGRLLAPRARIATVSQFSKGELAEVLRLNPDRIPVFYNGSEHLARIPPALEALDVLRLRDRAYFITLGNLTPNKNLTVALEALKRVPDALLVVVGSVNQRVFAKTLGKQFSDRLVFAGRVDDANVRGLLNHATALLFPSLYEGFGVPPLEAMASGCPVIASSIPPVREVCGEAAFYFDPHSAEQLAAAMNTLLTEPRTIRDERIRNGLDRAVAFSWDRSAQQLAEFCRSELLHS